MSKAFLPLGILAAAGVMGSLAGGQGSPARRRAKIHPVTGLERRGEFHYFKLGAKAYREGAARKDNPFKGWQAKWWDKGWAGVRPRRQRGRAARGRRDPMPPFRSSATGESGWMGRRPSSETEGPGCPRPPCAKVSV